MNAPHPQRHYMSGGVGHSGNRGLGGPPLYTISELARMMNISKATLDKAMNEPGAPVPAKFGTHLSIGPRIAERRYTRKEVFKWWAERAAT
jgi:hypothetical protein